jgi:hypothetical protein
VGKRAEIDPEMPTTTNNMVRVHPAQPSYSVVVPAPEPCSINVAVANKIGLSGALCKGVRQEFRILIADTPTPHREQAEAAVGSQAWARLVVDSMLKNNGE